MKTFITTVITIVLLIPLLLFPTRVMAASVSDVSSQLICQCGCTAVLSNCTHIECMMRDSMTTVIAQKLDQDQTPEQIIQFFAVQYGEQVLASPPKKGFNLTAWLLPFGAIAAGGLLVYLLMKKWLLRSRKEDVSTDTLESLEPDEYWDRVEKELANFSERSFR